MNINKNLQWHLNKAEWLPWQQEVDCNLMEAFGVSKEIIHQIERELVNHRWIHRTKDKYEQMHSRRFPNNIVTQPKDLSQTSHIFQKTFSNFLARLFYINNITIISLHLFSIMPNKQVSHYNFDFFYSLQAWKRVCSYGLNRAITVEGAVSIRQHVHNDIMATMTE